MKFQGQHIFSNAMSQLPQKPCSGQLSWDYVQTMNSVVLLLRVVLMYLSRHKRWEHFCRKACCQRENVFLKGFSWLVKPCRQNDTQHKHTRKDYGWDIHSRSTSGLNISQGTKSERGHTIIKHGFRAAGVQEIKAKFRQLILTGALWLEWDFPLKPK